LAELLGMDPARFIAVERWGEKDRKGWYVVTEGDEVVQTSGTMPQLSDNTTKRKPKRK